MAIVDNLINWDLISQAIRHYGEKYSYIEVPWVVSRKSIQITLPNDKYFSVPVSNKDFNLTETGTEDGVLVGSAEQSFLELESRGLLSRGRYMACTPCFRNELIKDNLHQKMFMKVELYSNIVSIDEYQLMTTMALDFFSRLSKSTSIIRYSNFEDIEINDVEVGSYGIRQSGNLNWIFGTGIAEPRCSTAIRMNK